jgi:hypothetical protein
MTFTDDIVKGAGGVLRGIWHGFLALCVLAFLLTLNWWLVLILSALVNHCEENAGGPKDE